MRTTTTVVLAVGAATLAVPASAFGAAQSDIQAPLAGHLTVASQMREVHTELAQKRLTRKAWRLARRLADHRDEGFSPVEYRRRVADDPPVRIARRIRTLRVVIKQEQRRERRRAAKVARAATASPTLEAIAACESGGNPGTNTGNGFYGKFQFTLQTWASVGGSGNPASASEAEQNKRAAMLYAREGSAPWPVCGR
jgi:hypothetical protein